MKEKHGQNEYDTKRMKCCYIHVNSNPYMLVIYVVQCLVLKYDIRHFSKGKVDLLFHQQHNSY